MSAPFKFYFSNERPLGEKKGTLIRGRRSLNISCQKRGSTSKAGALSSIGALLSKYGINTTNTTSYFISIEAVARRCSINYISLKLWQNSQEKTWAKVFLGWCCRPATLSKKKFLHRCFSVNFAKSLEIPIW